MTIGLDNSTRFVQILSLNGLSSQGEWTMGRERVCFSCCLALALIVSLALALQPGAFAQETTAGIQGTVKDAQGGTVPGATVEVTSSALIGKKEVKTYSTGVYRLTNLPPGDYPLSIPA